MSSEKILYEERILELEKKLLQSAQALNECKKESEEFIHIASHDLQAPLRKLSTFVERLTQKSKNILGEESLNYIERIEAAVASMRSLIDGLSSISDITGSETVFIKCDLNNVMNEAINDLEILIQEKNVGVSIAPLPTIEANSSQLKQVFINLLDNSIKFQNNEATPQIVITSEALTIEEKVVFNLDIDKDYYKIEFTDNGIGFKQEYADKIFKPFQRLHGKAAYAGNGLGLSICKKIIEKHRGIIYAKGNENAGARFVLILPEMHTP